MHVVRGLGAGGTEIMCLRLAQHWQQALDQRVVVWGHSPRTLEGDFKRVSRCALTLAPESRDDLSRWNWLRSIIRGSSPDAVLIHFFGRPHLLAAAAVRAAGVHAMAALAGNPPPQPLRDKSRWRAILIGSRIIDCPVIACSHAVDRELRDLALGKASPRLVIPNGIDAEEIAARAEGAHRKQGSRGPVIGMVARLNRIKDHDTLLRAFSILSDSIPDAELWIIGDGPLIGHLEGLAISLGIARRTCFLGERVDVAALLGQMDIYAFSTTRDEGFGIALIEAMAAGVPIVASDVPACREVLDAGAAGVLVPPSDAGAMARALADLLACSSKQAALTAAARERVKSEYSIEVCAARWERILFRTRNLRRAEEIQCAS